MDAAFNAIHMIAVVSVMLAYIAAHLLDLLYVLGWRGMKFEALVALNMLAALGILRYGLDWLK